MVGTGVGMDGERVRKACGSVSSSSGSPPRLIQCQGDRGGRCPDLLYPALPLQPARSQSNPESVASPATQTAGPTAALASQMLGSGRDLPAQGLQLRTPSPVCIWPLLGTHQHVPDSLAPNHPPFHSHVAASSSPPQQGSPTPEHPREMAAGSDGPSGEAWQELEGPG